MKEHNFPNKNRKLSKTFMGPSRVTQVNENETVAIRSKTAKHDNFVNTNFAGKFIRSKEETEKRKRKRRNFKTKANSSRTRPV
jgi:hypothetical protein